VIREGFLKLAEGRPGFVVVDATQSPEAVHRAVVTAVEKVLRRDDREK